MGFIADSLNRIQPSATIAVSTKARQLKAAGRDIISLSAGEPDFDTPDNIKQAAVKALAEGKTKYTDVDGTPELKAAIVRKFKRENDLDYKPNQISVGTGGKQVIYNALLATLNPGDEVVIPAPCWVSYADIVMLADAKPVFVETKLEDGYRLKPAALEAAITPKTKWLIFNSPSNPTGAAYTKERDQGADGRAAEASARLDPDRRHLRAPALRRARSSTRSPRSSPSSSIARSPINGLSKAYCMTGWRLGYAGGPDGAHRRHAQAAVAVDVEPMLDHAVRRRSRRSTVRRTSSRTNNAKFVERRDLVVSMLNQANGLRCPKPEGAFYVYPSCAGAIGKTSAVGQDDRQRRGLRHGAAGGGRRRRRARRRVCRLAGVPRLLRDLERTSRGSLPAHPAVLREPALGSRQFAWAVESRCLLPIAYCAGYTSEWTRRFDTA